MHLRGFGFLSAKPVLVAVNSGEDRIGDPPESFGLVPEERVAVVGSKLEEELAQLAEDEREAFLSDYGLDRTARDRLIQAPSISSA